jgi:hypothetical protein
MKPVSHSPCVRSLLAAEPIVDIVPRKSQIAVPYYWDWNGLAGIPAHAGQTINLIPIHLQERSEFRRASIFGLGLILLRLGLRLMVHSRDLLPAHGGLGSRLPLVRELAAEAG